MVYGSGNKGTSSGDRKKPHEKFAENIVTMLEKGVAPWQKSWKAGEYYAPFNPVSGTIYRGVNRLVLSNDLADPRWMTFKQAQEKGYRVKAGSKATPIEFWLWTQEVDRTDDDGRLIYGPDGKPEKETIKLDRPRVFYSQVFHASQLETQDREPIPAYDPPPLEWSPHDKAEAILSSSGAAIFNDQRDRAFYSPLRDEIHLPYRENFSTAGDYYNTALHELGHWACSKRRLDMEGGVFGSELYAKEELKVEIASWMICQDLGLDFQPENSASYIDHWVQFIKNDPYEIVRACRDAEKIKKYVLDLELGLKQEEPFVFTDMAVATPLEAGAAMRAVNNSVEAIYLQVPYKEKNQAKALGAKWDAQAKLWMAPAGTDLSKLAQWMPERKPAPSPAVSPEDELRRVMDELGLRPNGPLVMDGSIQRVTVEGGKPGSRDGAYSAHLDGVPNGWVMNHKTGQHMKWLSNGHTLSAKQATLLKAEVEARRRQREAEREKGYQEAAGRAFDKLFAPGVKPASPDHPYLKAKGVPGHGVYEDGSGNLLVEGLDLSRYQCVGKGSNPPESPDDLEASRHVQTLQTITPEGRKTFEPGTKKTGAAFLFGENQLKKIAFDQWRERQNPEPLLAGLGTQARPAILLAEGYATGASLFKATGLPVAVAFDAGNLQPVSAALKKQFPGVDLVFCADNDHANKVNIGVAKAQAAAQAVGGRVLVPEFNEEEKSRGLTDFNDLAQSRGLLAVAKQVSSRHRPEIANTEKFKSGGLGL